MRIFVLNGAKAAYGLFGLLCAAVILYFGFFQGVSSIEVSNAALDKVYVAVIINDFGNGMDGTREFLYMDIPFTGAVIPAMSFSGEESRLLHNAGKDVLVHIPMESHKGDEGWMGDLAVTADLSHEQISDNIAQAIQQIQNPIGISNHKGSKIMEDEEILKIVMTHAKENGFVFMDTLTTTKSKADTVAEEIGVMALRRDVYLDGTKDIKKIEKNFLQAADIARDRGFAIAIGHVGDEGGRATAQAMRNVKDQYDERAVEFITLSELLEILNKQ